MSDHAISHQQFADDTQMYITVSVATALSNISRVEDCLRDLYAWFCCNGLVLNSDKSECILLGTVQRARTLPPFMHINVAGLCVPVSQTIKTLGITFDSHLTFNAHIQSLTKACYFHIRALRHIRSCITLETAKSFAHAIVSSRLDYGNSLLTGISDLNMHKLQRVQTTLARVVLASPYSRKTSAESLRQLHWLPIRQRINFKIATLTYKILNSGEPGYLRNLLSFYVPARTLRSMDSCFLVEPRVTSTIGSRVFRSAAPKLWNKLPVDVRFATSVTTFRSRLKTHLFCQPWYLRLLHAMTTPIHLSYSFAYVY